MAAVGEFIKDHPKASFCVSLAALVLLCMIGSSLIETDRERVVAAIDRAEEALERGDVDGVMRCVPADFQQEGMDKARLREFVRTGLEQFGPPDVTRWRPSLEFEGDAVRCEFRVFVNFPQFRETGKASSKWRVGLRKADSEWLITEVTPLELHGQQVKGLLGLRQRYNPSHFEQ